MTVKVTEADREAAADAVKAYRDRKNGNWQQRIRDGLCDDGEMVQAFARHRQQALEEAAKVAERISDDASLAWHTDYKMHDQGRSDGADEAATAIRALKEQPQ